MSNNDPSSHSGDEAPSSQDLSASGLTISSESEPFSSLSGLSPSPPKSSSNNDEDKHTGNKNTTSHGKQVVIYSKPTFWSLVRGAAINLLLPFVNGMMLGLGELLAHEIAFQWGWGTTQIFPKHRSSRPVAPGVEIRDDPIERRRREGGIDAELIAATSLE